MPNILSLDKSLSVLEAIFQAPGGMGTRALEQRLGYNVATVHNIARTFCARGYLRQDPQSRLFFPGMRLMLLGRHPSYLLSMTAAAAPVVDEVAEKLNESVLLGSIDSGRVLNLKYVPGKQALRVQEPEDASDYSHCTAFGKILLASLSPSELSAYLRDKKLRIFTPQTLTTSEQLQAELAKVRAQGFARTRDEYCEGVSAVAVPIHDPWGSIIASIGASAPTVRMEKPRQFEEGLRTLREAAARIERIWGEEMHVDSEGSKKRETKHAAGTKRLPRRPQGSV